MRGRLKSQVSSCKCQEVKHSCTVKCEPQQAAEAVSISWVTLCECEVTSLIPDQDTQRVENVQQRRIGRVMLQMRQQQPSMSSAFY